MSDDALGDAIGLAVSVALEPYAVYHGPAHAFTDPCGNPDRCNKPHTHADVEPDAPAVRHVIVLPDPYASDDPAADTAY